MLPLSLSQYIVVKGVDTIDKERHTDDVKPEASGFIIEHIVPILTESEKIRIRKEVNDGLFQIFKKYFNEN